MGWNWSSKKKKERDTIPQQLDPPIGATRHGDFYEYVFNPRPQPQAGPAYSSPLLRYTEYPQNVWEGGRGSGVGVKRFFQSYEPQTIQANLNPIPAGGSGIIAGQFYSQPLTDTSNSVAG